MNTRSKLISLAAAAAMLLSGCNAETSVPSVSESETTTSAAEMTTTESATTVADTTTAVITTAEPKSTKPSASIRATSMKKEYETKLGVRYIDCYDDETETWTVTGGYIYQELDIYSYKNFDKNEFFRYDFNDKTSHVTDGDKRSETLVIDAEAADIYVRSSTYSFSEKGENDIEKRLTAENITRSKRFASAYNIVWDDPKAVLVKGAGNVNNANVSNPEVCKYRNAESLELGWHTDDIVTVNAFVCKGYYNIYVLVDPEYMYGLPMFFDSEYKFRFGDNIVYSDSILFTAKPVEDLALDINDYAYAKVKLKDVSCTMTQKDDVIKINNTCTVTDIEIIDEFSDITEYNISADDHVIAGMDKDPVMKEVYDAVMNAKADIYTEDTYGIVFLDLDFDGKPEVIVTRFDCSSDRNYEWTLDAQIYRVKDGVLAYIDTIPMMYHVVYYDGAFIALSALKNGTPAWFASVREAENSFETNDYLYTLDGDNLTAHPLFTSKKRENTEGMEAEYFSEGGNSDTLIDYYYFDEKIVPNVTMGKEPYSWNDENAPEDWEYLDWNGLKSTFGMWELFGFARADYCRKNLKESYSLRSNWMINIFTGSYNDKPERYELSEREFSHKIAYLIDDFYYFGTTAVEHSYWFLGDYAKPVIYLYPENQTDISVKVNFPLGGELTCTYPEYNNGWSVTAMPDGTLYDENGDEYYCLYWEGKSGAIMDKSKGFCVAGKDTAKFLREKLMYIGLTAREANEFIIYWLPKMQDNPYNIITLHTADYARSVPLTVSPAPDTQIRVFMTYKSSDTPVDIQEQTLPHYERNGFTLVEWGGSEE